jgi:soluble lytic murein transglycosylase-like protein
MTNTGPRWLSVGIVVGAIVTATSAGAWMRTPDETRLLHDHRPFDRDIAEAAGRHAVPERLVWAVIRVESGFDQRAVSPRGARGLMQLMPETAARLGVRDCFNPRENIDAGTRHLRAMLVRFRHDVRLAVAAYNAGEKPVLIYGGVPPYPETREYVAHVLSLYHAPLESRRPGADVRRIVGADGTVLYTNLAWGHLQLR